MDINAGPPNSLPLPVFLCYLLAVPFSTLLFARGLLRPLTKGYGRQCWEKRASPKQSMALRLSLTCPFSREPGIELKASQLAPCHLVLYLKCCFP